MCDSTFKHGHGRRMCELYVCPVLSWCSVSFYNFLYNLSSSEWFFQSRSSGENSHYASEYLDVPLTPEGPSWLSDRLLNAREMFCLVPTALPSWLQTQDATERSLYSQHLKACCFPVAYLPMANPCHLNRFSYVGKRLFGAASRFFLYRFSEIQWSWILADRVCYIWGELGSQFYFK